MIPWEREIYLTMLMKYIREENEKIKLRQSEINAKQRTGR